MATMTTRDVFSLIANGFQIDEQLIEELIPKLLTQMPEQTLIELVGRFGEYLDLKKQLTRHDLTPIQRDQIVKDVEYYRFSADPAPLFQKQIKFKKKYSLIRSKLFQNWKIFEKYVFQKRETIWIAMRQKSPQVDEILSNHRGVQFVEFAADRMYWLLYKFVWESPRVHANCGGRITYKTTEPNVIVSTRFYCGKCGEIVNPETWENTIYIKPSLHKVHDSDA